MFRDELMALNAIHQEQCRTNDLLELLLKTTEKVQGKGVVTDATKGRGGGDSRKGSKLPLTTIDSAEGDTGKGSTTEAVGIGTATV